MGNVIADRNTLGPECRIYQVKFLFLIILLNDVFCVCNSVAILSKGLVKTAEKIPHITPDPVVLMVVFSVYFSSVWLHSGHKLKNDNEGILKRKEIIDPPLYR